MLHTTIICIYWIIISGTHLSIDIAEELINQNYGIQLVCYTENLAFHHAAVDVAISLLCLRLSIIKALLFEHGLSTRFS